MALKMRITNIEQVLESDDQGQPTTNIREGELVLTAEFFNENRPATVLLTARHGFQIKPDQSVDAAWEYMMTLLLQSARRHFNARKLFAERTTRMQDERVV